MTEISIGVPHTESITSPERFNLEREYTRCFKSLNRTGILSILPESEYLGISGINGNEYPVPSIEQVSELFERNKDLIEKKREQGFTRLQMTPFAMPLPVLADRVGKSIREHAKAEKIFQTKRNPTDPDVPVDVNMDEPMGMRQGIAGGEEDGSLLYLPKSYESNKTQGITKKELLAEKDICPVPGWSIGLIEDTLFLAREGQGKILGGRRQLENLHSPKDYLSIFKNLEYLGETGWTPEDFLINFITRLNETNQISHDQKDKNVVYLTGIYLPNEDYVLFSSWSQYNRQVVLQKNIPEDRYESKGTRTMVRLGI